MFTSQIKPIETEYRGYRFRSRLEARWAVFFETLGLEWEYEPEGFVCDKSAYKAARQARFEHGDSP